MPGKTVRPAQMAGKDRQRQRCGETAVRSRPQILCRGVCPARTPKALTAGGSGLRLHLGERIAPAAIARLPLILAHRRLEGARRHPAALQLVLAAIEAACLAGEKAAPSAVVSGWRATSTRSPRMSASLCRNQPLAVMPPSTRKLAESGMELCAMSLRMASSRSRVWKATASSPAATMSAAEAARVSPRIAARASASQCGAPRP